MKVKCLGAVARACAEKARLDCEMRWAGCRVMWDGGLVWRPWGLRASSSEGSVPSACKAGAVDSSGSS